MKPFAEGRIVALFGTPDPASFVTTPCERLTLSLEGIAGDRHGGLWRKAGPREPWMGRGRAIRNDRQLTMVAQEELEALALRLGLPAVPPGLLGANLLVAGVPDLSRLPAGSRLAIGGAWAGKGVFDGSAILAVEGYNHPCRGPGRQLAAHFGQPDLEFAFRKEAASLRGLILSVTAPGDMACGDAMVVVPPPVAP